MCGICAIYYDETNFSWFEVEKVKGLTLTNLFLSELLTETLLTHVMNTVRRLQETNCEDVSTYKIIRFLSLSSYTHRFLSGGILKYFLTVRCRYDEGGQKSVI